MTPWILAARPKTLLAGVAPVAVGTALAVRDGVFRPFDAVLCLAGAMAIQIATNFCNDYFDYIQGADTSVRVGPTRAVAAGIIAPASMLRATALMAALALVIGGCLAWRAGWSLLVIAAVSVACGVWYTAGRYSLAYLGLAEWFVLVFFGPVAVAGTYFVQSRQWTTASIVAGLGPGWLAVALLVVNNLRDIDEDRAAGKRTLAVRFGSRFARWEYYGCLAAAAGVPFLLCRFWGFPWVLLATVIPLAALLPWCIRLPTLQGTPLNGLLGRTAAVLFTYAVTFCVAIQVK